MLHRMKMLNFNAYFTEVTWKNFAGLFILKSN